MSSLYEHFKVAPPNPSLDRLFFSPRVLGRVPFQGKQLPHLKDEELDELETRCHVGVRTFDLGDEKDLADYKLVLHRVANGWYVKLTDHHHFDVEKKRMYVHYEWAEPFHALPQHLESLAGGGRR